MTWVRMLAYITGTVDQELLRECFCWLKHEEAEEALTTVQKHSREGYNLAALLFFFLFLDNLLRRVEGQGWKGVLDAFGEIRRARLKPETMRVSFEEFSPTHDFFDYWGAVSPT